MSYTDAMDAGAAAYRDVTDALAAHGLRAEFTQTGGMCAAIYVPLEGAHLLITDFEDSLPWDREDHAGWLVGRYLADDEDHEHVTYCESLQGDIPTLLTLVDSAMRGEGSEIQ